MLFELLFGAITALDTFFLGVGFVLGGFLFIFSGVIEYSLVTVVAVFIAYAVYIRPSYRKLMLVLLQRMGLDCIVGKYGVACTDLAVRKGGWVMVDGERWEAATNEPIKNGTKIIVISCSGKSLVVSKLTPPDFEV